MYRLSKGRGLSDNSIKVVNWKPNYAQNRKQFRKIKGRLWGNLLNTVKSQATAPGAAKQLSAAPKSEWAQTLTRAAAFHTRHELPEQGEDRRPPPPRWQTFRGREKSERQSTGQRITASESEAPQRHCSGGHTEDV